MKNQRRSLAIATATAMVGGLSSVLFFAAPASAAPYFCDLGGTAVGSGVCELTYTSGTATFTPPAGTTKLEALLVGGGGGSYGGYGGGGGEVLLVNFTDTATPIDLSVAGEGGPQEDGDNSTTTQGTTTSTAHGGTADDGSNGGNSGNGNLGWQQTNWATTQDPSSAGAGAGASPVDTQDGGAGAVVSDLAPAGSLFADDAHCYGGGGAVLDWLGNVGVATCGGGYPHVVSGTPGAVPAVDGTGGGAGSLALNSAPDEPLSGASGSVIVRWNAQPVVTFDMNGHGSQVPAQTVITGADAVQPPTPTSSDATFAGWYTDPGLTTKADFSVPITADTTFYASWESLALTGVSVNPWTMPGSLGAVGLGFVLVLATRRRFGRRAV